MDIVDKLRDDYQKTPELCQEAANEIERLRDALVALKIELNIAKGFTAEAAKTNAEYLMAADVVHRAVMKHK